MLPKQYRLKHMKDFEILFKEGWFFGGELVTAKVWRVVPEKYPRRDYTQNDLKIGFVVGKKVSKSAVKRNRIKRKMREVVRLLLKEKKIKSGYMIAIVAKPLILAKKYEEIEKDITLVLRRAGVLR
jgi:ribonuclease P protein component